MAPLSLFYFIVEALRCVANNLGLVLVVTVFVLAVLRFAHRLSLFGSIVAVFCATAGFVYGLNV